MRFSAGYGVWSAALGLALSVMHTAPVGAQRRARLATTAEVAARAIPATTTILAIGAGGDTVGQGSGFILRPDGVVVTNYHVLAGASSAIVVLSTEERFTRVSVLDADSALDLAILKIPGAGLPTLTARTTVPRAGEKIVAIGSPLGLSQTVTEGIVSAARVIDGRELVQISAAISHGSSGGAVLDARGRVFAVSTSFLEGGESLNFAVPVRYALGLLGSQPNERSVAEVFAAAGSPASIATAARATPATTRSPNDLSGYRRAPHPRSDVAGTYGLTQTRVNEAGETILREEGVLIATRDGGWLAIATRLDSTQRDTTRIYWVNRWDTNAAGDVVLTTGGLAYDGWQTDDDGFVASASFSLESGEKRNVILAAVPYRLPLSRNDGIYVASVRSKFMIDGRASSTPTDWSGEMAVALGSGTMCVDLLMRNAAGGTTRFIARGPLQDGAFDLSGTDGSRLHGTVLDGVISAEWLDRRENNVAYSGTLVAKRK